jgi:hypothetical protein
MDQQEPDRIMDCVTCKGPVRYRMKGQRSDVKPVFKPGFARCARCGRWHRCMPGENWSMRFPVPGDARYE